MKVKVDDGSLYLLLQFFSATMIAQLHPTLGYKIIWGISHYMRCIVSMSYSVAIEYHCGSDVVELMQPESLI